jgi:hypothetical protein
MPKIADRRLALGRAAVLSISCAAELLPSRDSEGRAAIREAGIRRWHLGSEVVVWGDVLDYVLGPMARELAPANEPPLGWVPKRAPSSKDRKGGDD